MPAPTDDEATPTDETVVEVDPPLEGETAEVVVADEVAAESVEADEAEELVVSLGEEPAEDVEAQQAEKTPWVRELRKTNRELVRNTRRLEEENARLKGATAQQQAVVVGNKPTLEACNFDEEQFATELEAWTERKNTAARQRTEREQAEQAQRTAWQARLDAYNRSKTALPVKNFDEAEENVQNTLSVVQQGILLKGAKKPELIVLALHNSPKKLKELAAINDPVDFAIALGEVQATMKVENVKKPPAPDRRPTNTGAAVNAAAASRNLEALHQKARETRDYTAYYAAKREQEKRKSA